MHVNIKVKLFEVYFDYFDNELTRSMNVCGISYTRFLWACLHVYKLSPFPHMGLQGRATHFWPAAKFSQSVNYLLRLFAPSPQRKTWGIMNNISNQSHHLAYEHRSDPHQLKKVVERFTQHSKDLLICKCL